MGDTCPVALCVEHRLPGASPKADVRVTGPTIELATGRPTAYRFTGPSSSGWAVKPKLGQPRHRLQNRRAMGTRQEATIPVLPSSWRVSWPSGTLRAAARCPSANVILGAYEHRQPLQLRARHFLARACARGAPSLGNTLTGVSMVRTASSARRRHELGLPLRRQARLCENHSMVHLNDAPTHVALLGAAHPRETTRLTGRAVHERGQQADTSLRSRAPQ